MSFLTRDEMEARLNELISSDLTESRRAELITEIGNQHVSGLQEFEARQQEAEELQSKYGETRDALAYMYTQQNAERFRGAEGQVKEPDKQATVTLDQLLGR